MWHTSVLFTGTTKTPFSTPCISITNGLIYIKFINFMPSIYMTLHTTFKEIGSAFHEICTSENCPIFFKFFFFAPFSKRKFEPTKDTLFVDQFLSNLTHLLSTLWPISVQNLEIFKLNQMELWMIIAKKH